MTFVTVLFRFLSSLRLAISLFVAIAGIMVVATWYGLDPAIGAIRKDWYGSWWFQVLLGLLALNVFCSTLRRARFEWPHFGFIIAHTGILLVLFGGWLSFTFKIYGDLWLSEGSSSREIELEDGRELTVEVPAAAVRESFDFNVNLYSPSHSERTLRVPGTNVLIRILESLPHATLRDRIVNEGSEERHILDFRLTQAGQEMQYFLSEKNPQSIEGSPLSVYFDSASGAMFENMSLPAGEEGTLHLTLDGEARDLDVKENLNKPVTVGRQTVTLLKLEKNFDVGHPEDISEDTAANPALRFKVGEREYYAFALQGEHSPMPVGSGHGEKAPFEAQLRFNFRASAIWILRTSAGLKYVLTNKKGEKTGGTLVIGQKVRYPFMPLPLEFAVVAHYDRAVHDFDDIAPASLESDTPRQPALRVEVGSLSDAASHWIGWRRTRSFHAGETTVFVRYGPKRFGLPFHVTLEKFTIPFNPGTRNPSQYESRVQVEDEDTHDLMRRTITVNDPLVHRGYVLYQASYSMGEDGRWISVFQVSRDPGKAVVYLGSGVTLIGVLWMFYVKPLLSRRQRVQTRTV